MLGFAITIFLPAILTINSKYQANYTIVYMNIMTFTAKCQYWKHLTSGPDNKGYILLKRFAIIYLMQLYEFNNC